MQPTTRATGAVGRCASVRKLERSTARTRRQGRRCPADAELNEDVKDALPPGCGQECLRAAVRQRRRPQAHGRGHGRGCSSFVQDRLGARARDPRMAHRGPKGACSLDSLSAEFGLATPDPGRRAGFKKVATWQSASRMSAADLRLRRVSCTPTSRRSSASDRRPHVGRRRAVRSHAYASLQAHVDKGRLAYAMKRVQELVKKLEGHSGGIVDELREFLTESLGRPAADEGAADRMAGTAGRTVAT
jgi:hypothetical protein